MITVYIRIKIDCSLQICVGFLAIISIQGIICLFKFRFSQNYRPCFIAKNQNQANNNYPDNKTQSRKILPLHRKSMNLRMGIQTNQNKNQHQSHACCRDKKKNNKKQY